MDGSDFWIKDCWSWTGFEPWSPRYRCSVLPVKLSGLLGAGHYVNGNKHSYVGVPVFYSYADIFVWLCTKNSARQPWRVITKNSSSSVFTFQRSIYLINATCKPVALTLQFIDVYKTLDKGQEWALEFPLSWWALTNFTWLFVLSISQFKLLYCLWMTWTGGHWAVPL